MANFPNLRTGVVTMYPLAETVSTLTRVIRFMDDSEQRWPVRPPLIHFTLSLIDINASDLGNVRNFFIASKGMFDQTWSITIAGTTYNNMSFNVDSLTWREQEEGLYNLSIPVIQTKP